MNIKNINQKSVLISMAILLFIVLIFVVYKKNTTKEGVESNSGKIKEVVMSAEEAAEKLGSPQERLERYYALYEDPYVLHLRKVLDAYLEGELDEDSEGIADPKVVIEKGKREDGSLTGLDSFSKNYYKSKFVVMLMTDGKDGGKIMNIIFQDKQDKLFDAWVIQTDKEEYQLRGFWENKNLTDEQMEAFKERYKEFIEDEEHAI